MSLISGPQLFYCIDTGVETCHVLIRCSVCLQLTSQGRKTGIASLLYWMEQSSNALSSSAAEESTKLDGTGRRAQKDVRPAG